MGAGVGIEQQLVRIEAVATVGLVRAVDAIAVVRARLHAVDEAVKHLVGIFGQLEAVRLTLTVEQADLDLGGVGGEHRKVGAVATPMGAQRVG